LTEPSDPSLPEERLAFIPFLELKSFSVPFQREVAQHTEVRDRLDSPLGRSCLSFQCRRGEDVQKRERIRNWDAGSKMVQPVVGAYEPTETSPPQVARFGCFSRAWLKKACGALLGRAIAVKVQGEAHGRSCLKVPLVS
jgi:hypothetical protein